jgi:hypothetical protein
MKKTLNGKEVMELADEAIKDWDKYYKENGEPHPISNAYLELTRMFWLMKGVELAKKGIL